MFNLIDYRKRRLANNSFEDTIAQAKSVLASSQKFYYEYQNTCTHPLVIHLGKEGALENTNDFAICVCCGRHFHLEDMTTLEVKPESIISVAGLISDDFINGYTDKGNDIIVRAQEVLDALAKVNTDMAFAEIKKCLLNDLIEYFAKRYEERKCQTRKMIKPE